MNCCKSLSYPTGKWIYVLVRTNRQNVARNKFLKQLKSNNGSREENIKSFWENYTVGEDQYLGQCSQDPFCLSTMLRALDWSPKSCRLRMPRWRDKQIWRLLRSPSWLCLLAETTRGRRDKCVLTWWKAWQSASWHLYTTMYLFYLTSFLDTQIPSCHNCPYSHCHDILYMFEAWNNQRYGPHSLGVL